jgi:hypothetical protein
MVEAAQDIQLGDGKPLLVGDFPDVVLGAIHQADSEGRQIEIEGGDVSLERFGTGWLEHLRHFHR